MLLVDDILCFPFKRILWDFREIDKIAMRNWTAKVRRS